MEATAWLPPYLQATTSRQDAELMVYAPRKEELEDVPSEIDESRVRSASWVGPVMDTGIVQCARIWRTPDSPGKPPFYGLLN